MNRDIVFFTARNPKEPELRYALRSLNFIPHGTVWMVGGKPDWVTNVEHVPYKEGEKWQDLTDKWRILPTLPLSDEFIYTEDDYFITKPCEDIPNFTYPTPLNRRCSDGEYGITNTNTFNILKAELGRDDMPSYDVHIPLVVEKERLPVNLDPQDRPLRYRTLVGNTSTREPVPLEFDVKVRDKDNFLKIIIQDLGFISSSPYGFRNTGLEAYLDKRMPDYCQYEV